MNGPRLVSLGSHGQKTARLIHHQDIGIFIEQSNPFWLMLGSCPFWGMDNGLDPQRLLTDCVKVNLSARDMALISASRREADERL